VDILLAVDGLQAPGRLGRLPAHVQQVGNCGENAPRDEEGLLDGRHLEQEHQAAPPHRVPLQPIHTRAPARVQGQGLQKGATVSYGWNSVQACRFATVHFVA
jgi:hypothetical protein